MSMAASAFAGEGSPQAVEACAGDGLIGINADGGVIGLDRFGLVVHLLMHKALACPGIGVAVVDIQRGVEIFQGAVELVDLGQALAARQIGGGNKGIAVNR